MFGFLMAATAMAVAAGSGAEGEVLKAAQDLAQAQMKKDKAALDRLLGDDLIYSHSSGMVETKADHMKATLRPASVSVYERIEMTEPRIKVYGSTAVLTCRALYATNNAGTKAENHLTMLQNWVKRGSGWQLVARWTTRVTPK